MKTKAEGKRFLKIDPAFLFSAAALIISLFALRESQLANRLVIEPYLEIQSTPVNKETGKPKEQVLFLIKNSGNVDIRNVRLRWVEFSPKSSTVISSVFEIADLLRIREAKPFLIDLTGDIEPIKKETLKTPEGKEIYSMQFRLYFLGIKLEYRRASDSKLFEKVEYFVMSPTESSLGVFGTWGVPAEMLENAKAKIN